MKYILKQHTGGKGFDADYKDMSILDKLLHLRGVSDIERDSFLSPDFESGIHDPFLLKDMEKVVTRILSAIENNEHILIYSDYDADGLPGASIIHDFFTTISYSNVSYIAPDRHEKGFGLHSSVVEPYIDADCRLVITIDCGIADVAPCADIRAYSQKTKGRDIDIVVTDHHLPHDIVPDVFAIVNPKQQTCLYPEKMLCGAAVMYKIVVALVKTIQQNNLIYKASIPEGYEKWLLDLVGISTLSDMVPLVGENRVLAYFGLIVLRKSKRFGINALCECNAIPKSKMQEEDVTFTISPRINVASRLASPALAFDLLTAQNFDDAMRLAKELDTINTKRKTMVAETMKQVNTMLKGMDAQLPVIVIGDKGWKPPILGLVATQILKLAKKPVFVWGQSDDGLIKGSVRSVEGVDIVELMNGTREGLFVNKGGHAMSGGFSTTNEQVAELEAGLVGAFHKIYVNKSDNKNKIADAGLSESASPTGSDLPIVDLEIDIKDVGRGLYTEIAKLSPFGVGNERPIFAIRGLHAISPRLFGKTKEHLEIDCGHIKGIQFFTEYTGADKLAELMAIKNPVIIGQLELNQFRGASEVRIKVLNVI